MACSNQISEQYSLCLESVEPVVIYSRCFLRTSEEAISLFPFFASSYEFFFSFSMKEEETKKEMKKEEGDLIDVQHTQKKSNTMER